MRALLLLLLASGCVDRPDCGAYTIDGVSHDGHMCAEQLTRELRVSSEFTPEQQAAIVLAADEWRAWTGGRVSLSVVVVDRGANIFPSQLPAGVYADQDGHTGAIRIRPDLLAWRVQLFTIHELGHSFGLGHVTQAGLAMHPVCGPITAADVAHFDRVAAASGL